MNQRKFFIHFCGLLFLLFTFYNLCEANIHTPNGIYVDSAVKDFQSLAYLGDTKVFHLVSHGKPGALLINDQWLTSEELAHWLKESSFLRGKSHLMIYGCEFAKGEKGLKAVQYLERTLHIAVSASTNITGKDGDWHLEVGNTTAAIRIADYPYNLQDTDGDGILDDVDLDDDNDGISDLDECESNFQINFDQDSENFFVSTSPFGTNLGAATYSNPSPVTTPNPESCTFSIANTAGSCPPSPDGSSFILAVDNVNGETYFSNNVDLNKDLSSALGEQLTFYYVVGKLDWTIDPLQDLVMTVRLRGGGTTISTDINLPANTNDAVWRQYALDLDDATWSGTAANLTTVLNDFDRISFEVEFNSSARGVCGVREFFGIDNILFNYSLSLLVCPDTDGDGIEDHQDLDKDNDGIPDIIEAGGIDTNGDGYIDYPTPNDPTSISDLDNDGIADFVDGDCSYNETRFADAQSTSGTVTNPENALSNTPGFATIAETNTESFLTLDLSDTIPSGDQVCITMGSQTTGQPYTIQVSLDGTTFSSPLTGASGTTSSASFLDYCIDDNSDFRYIRITNISSGLAEDLYVDSLTYIYTLSCAGTAIVQIDTDGDGFPDGLDLDADNDGIPDLIEVGGIDMNGDGLVDDAADADNDGFADIYDPDDDGTFGVDSGEDTQPLVETTGTASLLNGATGESLDTDGDGLTDYLDLDADNDGIPDLVEAGGIDTNGDGRVDVATDADNDGYADIYDTDDDGIAGVEDATDALLQTGGTDTDGDGKADDAAITYTDGNANPSDTDNDGYPDHIDLDSDNDGIPDIVEVGASDPDNDGKVDTGLAPWDADGDGLADIYDENAADGPSGTGTNGTALVETSADTNADGIVNNTESMTSGGTNSINADGDNFPNHLDLDSDNDGITDVVENSGGDVTADHSGGALDGIIGDNASVTDADADGWHDPSNSTILDTDGDGIADYLDLDADNDGIPDYLEGVCSTCPTFGAPSGSDSDGDGVLDIYENLTSTNANSGTNTGTTPNEDDDDMSNPPDYLDTDTDNDGAYDWTEGFDANGDGKAADDLITMAANYETANGTPGDYNTTDTDGDGIPDWLDNQPGIAGYDEAVRPPFLDPSSAYWVDSNNNGLADLLDPEMNGTLAPTPDNNAGSDSDWRDMTTLPVELIDFRLEVVNCVVMLHWESSAEVNFNYFELEHSIDGSAYNVITAVMGRGNSISGASYQYRDDQTSHPENYYRLKMIDYDGSVEYTDILSANLPCKKGKRDLKIYPNPVDSDQHSLSINHFNPTNDDVVITMMDLMGRPVHRIQMRADEGWNMVQLDIRNLANGTYFIQIYGENARLDSITAKFIKLE